MLGNLHFVSGWGQGPRYIAVIAKKRRQRRGENWGNSGNQSNLKALVTSCHSQEIAGKKEAIKSSNRFSLSSLSNEEQEKKYKRCC